MFVSGFRIAWQFCSCLLFGSTSFDVVLEKSLVRIFRVCCLLFSYQCSFLLLPFHATAFILYQSVSCLSTTFLNYFLSLFIFISDNLYMISCVFCFVNTFFVGFIFIFKGYLTFLIINKIHHFSVTDFYNTIISFYCQAFYLNIVAIFIIILLSYKKLRI